ncbi:hypothetical protein LTS09_015566 [Friedmanniomyces endolithicus]|nr:hypothetical protein LTS09_015566 [Friedmanniomyces endolithicus]
MRVRSLSATALAAASIFQPFAIAQGPAVGYGSVHAASVVQDAAASASTSSATTTHTVTMTVMRVVQTEYATRDSTATPSLTLTPFSNGTASVLGTGAGPSMTATESAIPMLPSSRLEVNAYEIFQAHKRTLKATKKVQQRASYLSTNLTRSPPPSMQRVKNVDYDEDELYDDDEDYGEEPETYSQEDRASFVALIPVVRAELEEVGAQASDKEIQDGLWNYYWDVGKTVTYLKNNRTPKPQQQAVKKQEKPKSKFDEAAERSAKGSDTLSMLPPMDWFRDVPWTLPSETQGCLVPATQIRRPRLLGGASKFVKPAEEKSKKAAATSAERSTVKGALSSSELHHEPKELKGSETSWVAAAPNQHPIGKKHEPTPPPLLKSTPSLSSESEEQKPDLRASPTAFARTLSAQPTHDTTPTAVALLELLNLGRSEDPFKGPSPDGTVTKAQNRSKGMTKRP